MTILLQRLTLISALSTIVLAVFWPHLKPKLLPHLERTISILLSALHLAYYGEPQNEVKYSNKPNVGTIPNHPKFTGHSLKKVTSQKQSIASTYRSVDGFAQSPLTFNPGSSLSQENILAASRLSNSLPLNNHNNNNQSSLFLTLFTASVIAVVIYTLMKMLSARYGIDRSDSSGNYSNWAKCNKEEKTKLQFKRHKITREERIRQLMLKHGGKNVSSAVRFLIGELEKQKHSLVNNLITDQYSHKKPCSCVCHSSKSSC